MRPQLDPGDITQHQLGAIATGSQHDGGECLGGRQLPLNRERNRQALPRQGGLITEAPGAIWMFCCSMACATSPMVSP